MKTIRKMIEHIHWANQRILETLQAIGGENPEVNRLFSHILLAEKMWIMRLQGVDYSQLPIWSDEIDLKACAELVKQNDESYTTFLADLDRTDLDQTVSYTNSKGITFQNTIREILIHVALHGQYHRGQINSRLRANGAEPVQVDFIAFVR